MTESTSDTSDLMARALKLARETTVRVSPNPAVGAVIVKDGQVVGEGRFEGAGTRHAEVAAIANAGDAARDATLYVTLEPCCHQGRTPPCADAVIEAGVAEVYLSHVDPDDRVSGRGKAKLESAGIRVDVGDGEAEARRMNEAYLKHRSSGLPFVIVKFAASLDGKIAATSGDSNWVSGPQARGWAHQLRSRIDAIAVGVNTILVDDPRLTARPQDADGRDLPVERQPLRVVLDSRGSTPRQANVLGCEGQTLIATTEASPEAWRREMEEAGARATVLPADDDGHVSLPALLKQLGESDVLTLLVEGGGILLGSFFDQGLVDKVQAVIAPTIIGGEAAPTAVAGRGASRMAEAMRLQEVTMEQLGEDVLVTGYPPERA